MTNAPFETLGYDRIPVYPQPSIFATTIAYSEVFGDEFGHEAGLIDAATVAEILAEPAWSASALRAEVTQRMDTTLRAGWGRANPKGREHFFVPSPEADDWREVQSLCTLSNSDNGIHRKPVTGRVGREATITLEAETPAKPCGNCTKRLHMQEIAKEVAHA